MAGHTEGGARVPGSDAAARDHENQIKQGEVVDHVEATRNPISPVPELAGNGRGRAATPQRPGGREGEEICDNRVRASVRGERERGVGSVFFLARPGRVGRTRLDPGQVWAKPIGPAQQTTWSVFIFILILFLGKSFKHLRRSKEKL
jgi:hypothetical protein